MANVYVFNLSQQPIFRLMVNGIPATSLVSGVATPISMTNPLAGWSTVAPTNYQPNGIPIPRSPLPENDNPNPAFSQVTVNQILAEWEGGNQLVQFNVDMSDLNPPINEDYLLYIAVTQSILFDQFGTTVYTYPTPASTK